MFILFVPRYICLHSIKYRWVSVVEVINPAIPPSPRDGVGSLFTHRIVITPASTGQQTSAQRGCRSQPTGWLGAGAGTAEKTTRLGAQTAQSARRPQLSHPHRRAAVPNILYCLVAVQSEVPQPNRSRPNCEESYCAAQKFEMKNKR